MKYHSKAELIEDSTVHWNRLWELVRQISDSDLARRFGTDESRSAIDHLAHVYCWHRLLLQWIKSGPQGNPDLPEKGYKWNQTRSLNQMLFEEFKDETFLGIRRKVKRSHGRILKFVDQLSEAELIEPGHYTWTKKLPLTSYIGPNTAGHYRWAQKKIRSIISECDRA